MKFKYMLLTFILKRKVSEISMSAILELILNEKKKKCKFSHLSKQQSLICLNKNTDSFLYTVIRK